jgi:hypothetical protein
MELNIAKTNVVHQLWWRGDLDDGSAFPHNATFAKIYGGGAKKESRRSEKNGSRPYLGSPKTQNGNSAPISSPYAIPGAILMSHGTTLS